MKKFVVVLVVLVAVGLVMPAEAGGLLDFLFGSNRPTVAQFVTPTCKVSVTPRDFNFNVRQFAMEMPDGIAVQPVWDLRVPLVKEDVQCLTGILELTPGSGEITRVELTLDGQRDAFVVVDPPAVVEDRELWLRDCVAELRARYRRDEGQRLPAEVFPPFVSVGKYQGKPQGPVIFALPVTQLEFGPHSITTRVFTRGGGQQVAEAVVEFLIIPDPSGMVNLNDVPGSPAALRAVQPQAPAYEPAPPMPPTPRTPSAPAPGQVTLTPEARRIIEGAAAEDGYRGDLLSSGTYPAPAGEESVLFLVVLDQAGRIWQGKVLLWRGNNWERWNAAARTGLFRIPPSGVVPGETVRVEAGGANLTVTMPPRGMALWLPIIAVQ